MSYGLNFAAISPPWARIGKIRRMHQNEKNTSKCAKYVKPRKIAFQFNRES